MDASLLDSLMTRCRRVFLRGYEVSVRIGVNHREKHGPQRVRFHVDLYVLLAASTPRNDQLREVLDYDLIRDTIAERISRGHIHLLETLCDDAARALLAHPSVAAVRLSAEKPDVYPDCDSIGVEVFFAKTQQSDP
jgi:dihydroneopterin aldolase